MLHSNSSMFLTSQVLNASYHCPEWNTALLVTSLSGK